MPIQLTTPIPVGGLDEGDYTHVKIVAFRMDPMNKRMDIRARAGRIVEGVWFQGKVSNQNTGWAHNIEGAEYDTITAIQGQAGSALYDQVANSLYQYMLDKGAVVGTIV